MAYFRDRLRRCLSVCLTIGAAVGALFGSALLVTALTGSSTPSSILLGGFGFILLVLSVLVFVLAISQWKAARPGDGG
jgi:hypothetical protein